ncbi:MAG: acyl carrier protein [Kiritimatiellae bacterium]|nr:acyl carrier protein [Kiritimatiellia bacterium]
MNEFLSRIEDVVGVEVELGTRFRETPDWCSLRAFGILVMLENRYGVRCDIAKFMGFDTVGELWELAQEGERV